MTRIIKIKASDGDLKIDLNVNIKFKPGKFYRDRRNTIVEKLTDHLHGALKEHFYVSNIKLIN